MLKGPKLYLSTIVLAVLLAMQSQGAKTEDDFLYDTFPPDFLWGFSTSSYQSEGAAYEIGKGLSNYDYVNHNGTFEGHCASQDCSNGDLATDSYHKFPEDTKLLKDIGANFYRFSLSWTRIVPTGRVRDGVNQAGIDHYSQVIDNLLEEGIQPFITLNHYDLPLPLMWEGGWLNPAIIHHFQNFARIAFANFGDRVQYWITFNEPGLMCLGEFKIGMVVEKPPEKRYACGHNVIKAHAITWRMYDREFRPSQKGLIGVPTFGAWAEPKDPRDPQHVAASHRFMQFNFGWFPHALLYGQYPKIMRDLVDKKSAAEGRKTSRLPTFDPKWTRIINGTLDFLGLNYYSAYLVQPDEDHLGSSSSKNFSIFEFGGDTNVAILPHDPSWSYSAAEWPIVPQGIRKVLQWISNEYPNVPIHITENGYGDFTNGTGNKEATSDPERVNYHKNHINNVLKAIKLDGLKSIKSYSVWSLMDLFEFIFGYSIGFGVYYVNRSDPNLARTPKDSAHYLKQIIADNGFIKRQSPNCGKQTQI